MNSSTSTTAWSSASKTVWAVYGLCLTVPPSLATGSKLAVPRATAPHADRLSSLFPGYMALPS
eukprot:2362716-Amphidinium_carterae.1